MKTITSFLVVLCSSSLAFGAEIRGRVLDATGAPAAKVRVIAAENTVAEIEYTTPKGAFTKSPSESDTAIAGTGKLTGEAITDTDGRFVLSDLREAHFTLLAVDSERGFAVKLDVAPGATTDLALVPPARISGRWKGLRFDRSKHVLQLKPRAPIANIVFSPNVDQANDGGFRFGPLPDVPGWNLVLTEWVAARDFAGVVVTEPVDVAAGNTKDVVLDLDAGRTVTGVVHGAHGEPLENVAVVARSTSTPARERGGVTAKDGTFRLRGLADGEWHVEARRWTMRPTAGCGVGPKDVHASQVIVVDSNELRPLELNITRLLDAPHVGDMAPEFEVTTLDGRVISSKSLRGKVVLVDFWATWCGMCRAEFPKLRDTYAKFEGGTRFEIVGASIDETPEPVKRLVKTLGLTWPQTSLGAVETNSLAQLFNVAATPTSYLIDREGRIVAINAFGDELRAALTKLLGAK